MLKYTILGVVNVLLALLFGLIVGSSPYSSTALVSFNSFIRAYAPNIILGLSLLLNILLAYKLLVKKEKKLPIFLYTILTFSTLFWAILLFIGYFFASSVLFPVVAIILTIGVYLLVRSKSQKIAIILSLVTLLVSLVVVISNFEEDYCFRKGMQADPSGSKMITATKLDENGLKEFDVKAGNKIGISFRTHMLCHNTFNFSDGVKDTYFSIKK